MGLTLLTSVGRTLLLIRSCFITCTMYAATRVPYSGKVSREKTFAKTTSTKISFRGCILYRYRLRAHAMFAKKTFTNELRSAKFAKVFSLESFPLYGRSDPLS